MDEQTLFTLVTNSTALEGSTLTLRQNEKLLGSGISSEGKTIAEQLLNLDVREAYLAAIKDAGAHQVWSGYRIKLLAAKALRSYGFDTNRVGSDAILQGICREANEARMHAHSLGKDAIREVALSINDKVEDAGLWPRGNGLMARLLMNMLEIELGLEPTTTEFIREEDPVEPVVQPKIKTSTRVLEILSAHPRYTTDDLAKQLGISSKGVEKHLAKLKKSGYLQRIGPDKGGWWKVIEIR